ncbi:MAG TPA: aminotransferase class V-fold PLP-dependent enzyme [Candidatus Kapabacteria bacterium]|nr:aminotransferase class V-fold PLP-dependent enzyme [Candidatus Kapabacteria bacterium]
MKLENYFDEFRNKTIGIDSYFDSPFGKKKIVYADWTASGRAYKDIELKLYNDIVQCIGNTHTETSFTGSVMTLSYHKALQVIKNHVNADKNDVIISQFSGMTGVVNKLQRILGLKVHEKHRDFIITQNIEKPIIFITHMEHHSNQTSWLETIADVEIIKPNSDGLVDLEDFSCLLDKYKDRTLKIAAVTSCSNVTGVCTPYYQIAEMIHKEGGYCFVDFAASAPYINIDMHPENKLQSLDAIYFSPHKFLGGPGSTGILIFNKELYHNTVPDQPGGGTVKWTNPWGGHSYLDDIQSREDGGTPAFLQTIRAALAINLKEKMSVEKIQARENEILKQIWERLLKIDGLQILSANNTKRLGIISFCIKGLHYNLAVKLLNDRFGIQVRGGCSCAGTYGHYLLNIDKNYSNSVAIKINEGDLTEKMGWVRLSIHPIMTDATIDYICSAIEQICEYYEEWKQDYTYNNHTNEFYYKGEDKYTHNLTESWFQL